MAPLKNPGLSGTVEREGDTGGRLSRGGCVVQLHWQDSVQRELSAHHALPVISAYED